MSDSFISQRTEPPTYVELLTLKAENDRLQAQVRQLTEEARAQASIAYSAEIDKANLMADRERLQAQVAQMRDILKAVKHCKTCRWAIFVPATATTLEINNCMRECTWDANPSKWEPLEPLTGGDYHNPQDVQRIAQLEKRVEVAYRRICGECHRGVCAGCELDC